MKQRTLTLFALAEFDIPKFRDDIRRRVEFVGRIPRQRHGVVAINRSRENDRWDRHYTRDTRLDESRCVSLILCHGMHAIS